MKLQRFSASNLAEAEAQMKATLGPDAVILDVFEEHGQVEIFATVEATADWQATSADADEPVPEPGEEAIAEATPATTQPASPTEDLMPESLTAELYMLRKTLRRELSELSAYRLRRQAEDEEPNPVTEKLHAELDNLQSSLAGELVELKRFRDAATDIEPATRELQDNLSGLQGTLAQEIETLAEYRQKRLLLDAELDPKTSRRWKELNKLQDSLSSELAQLCEYRIRRAEIDAESDPRTEQLQEELERLNDALSQELENLRACRETQELAEAEERPRTERLQRDLTALGETLGHELEALSQYRIDRARHDQEADPALENLLTRLGSLESGFKRELDDLAHYRNNRLEADRDNDEFVRNLGDGLSALKQDYTSIGELLSTEVSELVAYRSNRESEDALSAARTQKLQNELGELSEAMAGELAEFRGFRQARESEAEELDVLTRSLHTELTKLQGTLRGELVQLVRQRKYRAELDEEQSGGVAGALASLADVQKQLAADQAELRQALTDGLSDLRQLVADSLGNGSTNTRGPATLGREEILDSITVGSDDILENGGVIALTGAQGVGKTTTVAKLAGQFAARHGAGKVAFITTDNMQIGGATILSTTARELAAPLATVTTVEELNQQLDLLSDSMLIIIDTAGTGTPGNSVTLPDAAPSGADIEKYLVVSATAARNGIEDDTDVDGYAGAIITKIDETDELAPALRLAGKLALPVSYLCDGREVPQDLKAAEKRDLSRMLRYLARRASDAPLKLVR